MFLQQGTIEGFSGSWGSGLGYLIISGTPVPCDNGPTVRALRDAFGDDVIARGHTANNDPITDQEVVYWLDDFGLVLGGFIPISDWYDAGNDDIGEEGLEWPSDE